MTKEQDRKEQEKLDEQERKEQERKEQQKREGFPKASGADVYAGKPEHAGKPSQRYVVKTEFTDDTGKVWTVGSAFTGDENTVRKALAAGKIETLPVPTPAGTPQEPGPPPQPPETPPEEPPAPEPSAKTKEEMEAGKKAVEGK